MHKSLFTWREYRARIALYSIIPIFKNSNSLKSIPYLHHQSLYGFTEEDARIQMRLGNVIHRTVKHYSEELIIDVDNTETAEKVYKKLIQNDVDFELYRLNNYKFFLTRYESDEPSEEMCFQDKQFVKDNFYDCNVYKGIDLSIYSSPFHLCRMRNSFHEGTGKKTQLIYKHSGITKVSTNKIIVKYYDDKKVEPNFDVNSSEWEKLQFFINQANGYQSNKHFCIFGLSKDLRQFFDYNTALNIALVYARSLNYDEEKAERAFHQGYES